MKNLFKVTALAVLAVLMAVSCSSDIEQTPYDWSRSNTQFDNSQNENSTGAYEPDIDWIGISPGVGSFSATNREVQVTFPAQADIWRSDNLIAAMSEFLTFHTVATGGDSATWEAGTLNATPAVTYTFVRQQGLTITISLSGGEVDLIAKIDASKYTFAQGHMLDTDDNGVPGESALPATGHDNLYSTSPASLNTNVTNWVEPRNLRIEVRINTPTFIWNTTGLTDDQQFAATNALLNDIAPVSIIVGGTTYTTFNPANETLNIIRTALGGDAFANNFKLETLNESTNTWAPVAGTSGSAIFHPDTHNIVFQGVTVNEFSPIRVVYTGFPITTPVLTVSSSRLHLGQWVLPIV